MSDQSVESLAEDILLAAVAGDGEILAMPIVGGGFSVRAGDLSHDELTSEGEMQLRLAINELLVMEYAEPVDGASDHLGVTPKGEAAARDLRG